VLVEHLVPDQKVRDRLAALCVGLAADCDLPERENEVAWLLQAKFPGAPSLPFVGIVTDDMQWIGGWSGGTTVDKFVEVLDAAEKSPLRPATAETRKALEELASQAAKAAEKSDWKAVMAASKSAAGLKGRAPAREALGEVVTKAREWAETELAKALESVRTGGDRAAVRARLKKVSAAFAGEPEQKDADQGAKALDKLTTIEGMAADQQDAAREKAAKEFAGSRWTALFEKPAAEPPK
jgi:hypothetical protein